MNTKQDLLKALYRKAVGAGLCKTQKEWAEMIGIHKSGLSAAMNGDEKFLTDSLMRKVTLWAEAHGLGADAPAPQPAPVQPQHGIFIPDETLALYTNLSEAVRNLSAILRQMNVPLPQDVAAKNPFLTNK